MIPTADEILKNSIPVNGYRSDTGDADYSRDECIKAIIKHTKLHVEAALKAASEKAEAEPYSEGAVGQCGIDADSILNAYPLTNIK